MELQHLIRSKLLPLELTMDLLHIARGGNVIEDLIDYIKAKDLKLSEFEDIAENCACESLNEEIHILNSEIEYNEKRLEMLYALESEKVIKADSLKNLGLLEDKFALINREIKSITAYLEETDEYLKRVPRRP